MNKIELDIKFCNDLLMIESFLQKKDQDLVKVAFSIESFGNSIKSYFENQIDPNNKTKSILNLLTPGTIVSVLLKPFPIISWVVGILASWMGIDFVGIFQSIFNKVKSAITSGSVSPDIVESATDEVISSQDTTFTPEQQAITELGMKNVKASFKENSIYVESYFKLNSINKYASANPKKRLLGFIGSLISTILKVALIALGLNVATNTAKKMMGQPNAFENKTYLPKTVSIVKSTQTVFPVKSSYSDRTYNVAGSNWIEKYNNSTSGISSMLLKFAKEVYDGLDSLDQQILNNPSFQIVLNKIEDYNINSAGESIIFIPKEFNSKKQLVDHFIDDVAARSKKS